MPRKSNVTRKSKRAVNYLTLTYVEDRERIDHLGSLLKKGENCLCWIIHDKDTLDNGLPDKVHCHAIVHLSNAMSSSAFATNYAVRERMVRPCRIGDEIEDLDGALLYLIHADKASKDAHKYQYNPQAIVGPWADYARERIATLLNRKSNAEHDEAQSFLAIQCFIESSLHLTMTELSRWAASSGHWAAFRRSSSIIRDCLREHNEYLDRIAAVQEYQDYAEELRISHESDVLYRELGVRALRTLNGLLHQAGRPSLKLLDDIEKAENALERYKEQKRSSKVVDMELLESI